MTALFGSKGQYGTPSVAINGIKVKSKAEKTIADYLVSHGIKYEYEKMVRTWAKGKKIGFPDFYLPDYKIYIEYWGLVDQESYNQSMKRKMAKYYDSEILLINLYPNHLTNLDWILPKMFKEKTGKDFPPLQKDHQETN